MMDSKTLARAMDPSLRLLWFAFEGYRDTTQPRVQVAALRQLRRHSAELDMICNQPETQDCSALLTAMGEALEAALDAGQAPSTLVDVLASALSYLRQRHRELQDGKGVTANADSNLSAIMRQLERCGARTVSLPRAASAGHNTPQRSASPTGPIRDRVSRIPPDLRRSFITDLPEDVTVLRRATLQLQEHSDDEQASYTALITAHKIRGTADTMDWQTVCKLAGKLEDIFEAMRKHSPPAPELIAAAMPLIDLLQIARDEAHRTGQEAPRLVNEAQRLSEGLPFDGISLASAGREAPTHPPADEPMAPAMDEDSAMRTNVAVAVLRDETQYLDDLVTMVTAVSSRGQILHDAGAEVGHLLTELSRSVERALARVQVIADGESGPAVPAAQEAVIALKEAVEDTALAVTALRTVESDIRQTSQEQEILTAELHRDLLHLRLVPLAARVPVLETTARVMASEQGKRVRFSVRGEDTVIDRDMSDTLAEPLYQLVRNAVAHGVEKPEVREAAGKLPEAHVWFSAHHIGNEVRIEIGDDGRGINVAHVRAAAVRAGLLVPDDVDPERDANLIFDEGVSTWPQADLAAGRGVGLNQVRMAIQSLGGEISVSSTPGQGTVFHVRVPVSLQLTRTLVIESDGERYAIPVDYLDRVITAPANLQAQTRAGILGFPAEAHEAPMPIRLLDDLLARDREAFPHNPVVLLLRHSGKRFAVVVDAIGEQRELVVRALPTYLCRPVTRSAAITPNGQVVLMLDMTALHGRITGRDRPTRVLRRHPQDAEIPRILIVDDSLTIRRALSDVLMKQGFEVETARDGIDALEAFKRRRPHVMVLDIEMPRMDGFEFLEALRDSGKLEGVTVLMLTASAGDNILQRAHALGAQHIAKPVPFSELVERIRAALTEHTSTEGPTS